MQYERVDSWLICAHSWHMYTVMHRVRDSYVYESQISVFVLFNIRSMYTFVDIEGKLSVFCFFLFNNLTWLSALKARLNFLKIVFRILMRILKARFLFYIHICIYIYVHIYLRMQSRVCKHHTRTHTKTRSRCNTPIPMCLWFGVYIELVLSAPRAQGLYIYINIYIRIYVYICLYISIL